MPSPTSRGTCSAARGRRQVARIGPSARIAHTSSSLRRSGSCGGSTKDGGVPRVDSGAIHSPSGDQVRYPSLMSVRRVREVDLVGPVVHHEHVVVGIAEGRRPSHRGCERDREPSGDQAGYSPHVSERCRTFERPRPSRRAAAHRSRRRSRRSAGRPGTDRSHSLASGERVRFRNPEPSARITAMSSLTFTPARESRKTMVARGRRDRTEVRGST